MSSYSELIKNFEKIRSYMREFYVYGFKSREEYSKKSARLYDDERRRIESWLGKYMNFERTADGKNVFISIDSRKIQHNPFFRALKAKSFTDGDITLHFILFDIMSTSDTLLSLPEILGKIDEYLSHFENPMVFDESTIRKKLKEYVGLGIITAKKQGKRVMYSRTDDISLPDITDALNFYSEIAPIGVVGSFILDKREKTENLFCFKHHYITSAMDSDVLADLFTAIRQKRIITVMNLSRRGEKPRENRIIPLKIFISVQSGRQHLIAYHPYFNVIKAFRVDYLSNVKLMETSARFDELRKELDLMQNKMWGVSISANSSDEEKLEYVTFTVKIKAGEEYIINRLEREKRCGYVEKVDDFTYRFSATVYDSAETRPFIRTFISRITSIHFSNPKVEKIFKEDLEKMYEIYGIGGANA